MLGIEPFSPLLALSLTEKLVAVAVVFQSIELLQLRKTVMEDGIWQWSLLRKEFAIFPKIVQNVFDLFLEYPNFIFMLWGRLLLGMLVIVFPQPLFFFFLLLSTILIALRWRGVFNGGSDYMTIIVLMALTVATAFIEHPMIVIGSLWYIAIQSCFSYFISGLVKIRKSNWRNGAALGGFLSSTIYEPNKFINSVVSSPILLAALSWIIMAFELSFPIVFTGSAMSMIYVSLAFVFHLANFVVFGLNRFVFIWCSTYPAVLCLSSL